MVMDVSNVSNVVKYFKLRKAGHFSHVIKSINKASVATSYLIVKNNVFSQDPQQGKDIHSLLFTIIQEDVASQ